MIGTTVSHYKILKKLGEGGMGIVYKAHDTKLNRDVALKFLPQSLSVHEPERARFLQEAQAAAALNNANICAIYSIGEEGEQQFIEMEYVDGVTLRRKIEDGKLRIEDSIGYAIRIAEALHEAHSHDIVHRDIKADNIMVNQKNQVKVMDFGLAKLKGSLHLTKTSSTIGTLAYMAPEQIEGEEVDGRSDIFSFGIVLYEMLTGHLPFRGEHEAAMMYSIVNEPALPVQHYLPEAPSELLHILDRALEKDREDRYQTVQEMLIDLRRLKKDSTRVTRHLNSGAALPRIAPLMPATEGKQGKRKLLWIGIAAVVVLIVLTLSIVLLRKHGPRLNPNRTSVALTLPFKFIMYPYLSGDGKWMGFPALGQDGTYDIYMMNTAGSTPRRVTEEHAFFMLACDISPDLSQIAYSEWSNRSLWQVKVVDTEGGHTRTLADTGYASVWRPDGKRVGYLRFGRSESDPSSPSGKLEIWSIRPDGGDRRRELIDTVSRPTLGQLSFCWSPDIRSIAWVRNLPEGYGEVMVRELATGKEEQLTHDKARIDEVNWTTNEQILFISNKSGQSNLWMVPAQGGQAIQITQGTVPIMSSRISTDTKRILFYQVEDIRQIWTSSADGSRVRQVTTDEVLTRGCAFAPDGRSIVAAIGSVDQLRSGTSLYVMDREGKNRQVMATGAYLGYARWSPDGKWLAYEDSGRVFLAEPLSPGTPRLLCEGAIFGWWDSDNLMVGQKEKSFQYSLTGTLVRQLSVDSVHVWRHKGTSQILYLDRRQGRSGWWIGSLDSLGQEPEKSQRLVVLDSVFFQPWMADFQSVLGQKKAERWGGIWRVSLSKGNIERIGKVPAPWMSIMDMTNDGKELLWIKWDNRAKLSMIEQPFE